MGSSGGGQAAQTDEGGVRITEWEPGADGNKNLCTALESELSGDSARMFAVLCDMHIRTLRFEAREDKDEIVVEVWKLVQLLQFLQPLLRNSSNHMHSQKHTHPHSWRAHDPA